MKLLVALATRGRPLRLAGALHSFTTLESGQHQVEYVVRVDDDDHDTRSYLKDLKATWPVEAMVLPRPVTLGQAWNEIAASCSWDACVVAADKHLCLTNGWDRGVAEIAKQKLRLARWHLLRAPEETVLIMPRPWYDALGRVFPEFFPFWFSERWVWEVHELAFGRGIALISDMPLTEPALKTQGLRDLEFWFDFFARSRFARIEEADRVCRHFGVAAPDRSGLLAQMRASDAWQKPRIAGYYQSRGEAQGPPSEHYLTAKRCAAEWLGANELQHLEVVGVA